MTVGIVIYRTGEDSLKELNDDEREQRLTEARTQLEEQCS
jgi:formate hydrogenlyase subunit 3/multisubunit Na+/H+ antiporter MnhD subunit